MAVLWLTVSAVAPAAAGDALPVPPQQKADWTPPPAKVPDGLISATRALFEQGLADPRGLAYREVELTVGGEGNDPRVVKTRGWAFPPAAAAADAKVVDGKGPDAPRFVVAWNGLVYPAVTVGPPADLGADVAAACDADAAMRAAYEQRTGRPGGFERHQLVTREHQAVRHDSLRPVWACLLLRLGEGKLAERVWSAWSVGVRRPDARDGPAAADDPYLVLATDWLWGRYDRAVGAHTRADDRLALADLRTLAASAWPAAEAEAKRRKFKPLTVDRDDDMIFTVLDRLPRLLADQERRARQPVRTSGLAAGPKAFPDRAGYVAALIADFEHEGAMPPVVVGPNGESVREALVKEGEAAVEPLIRCVEEDPRLTRLIPNGMRFDESRRLQSVRESALYVLDEILGEQFDAEFVREADREPDKRVVATRIRAHWAKFKGVGLVERAYRTLADDAAGFEPWAQAAANLCAPLDPEGHRANQPYPPHFIIRTVDRPGRERRPRQGDALRDRKNPSVTELFVRRLGQAEAVNRDPRDPNDAVGDAAHRAASALGAAVLVWDGRAHHDLLRAHTAYLHRLGDAGAFGQRLLAMRFAIGMYLGRAYVGDDRALAEYAERVKQVTPERADGNEVDIFEPIWRHAAHPAVAAAAEHLFDREGSPYNPLIRKGSHRRAEDRLLTGPMLGVPVFRKQVLRMLADRTEVGTMLVRAAGGAKAENALGAHVGHRYDTADPLAPPPGTKVAFRTCDVYAHLLSRAEGTPKCELYWPADKRDAAVDRCAEVLGRYGDRYRPADPVNADAIDGELVLPPLDRPATPDDVRAGRAVFTLLGDGRPADQVRLVPLPGRPVRAKWATLKAYPRDVPRYVPETGGQKVERVFEQDGKIWQAEEVLEGGRWRRYLGFVGRYDVDRVAAEEVEVTAGWYGGDLTRGLACTVCPPGIDETGRIQDERPRLGDPLTVTAFLGNRTGLDQAVPARYAGQGPDDKPALIPGVRLRLFVSERSIGKPSPDRIYVGYDRRDDWRELPANPRPPLAGDPGSRALAMGERAVAFRVDLRDWFDVARPGDYEVQVEFDERQGGPATGTSQRMAFPVMAKP